MDESWDAPRYEKVYAHLLEQVTSGTLRPGDRLPGERRFAHLLGVSRETIRQGFRLAEDAGLIVRVPARGTFVAEPRIRQDLGHMQSFDLTVRGANLTPRYDDVVVGDAPAGPAEAAALGTAPGAPLLTVTAVGMGDHRPLAHYRSLIPRSVADRLPTSPDWHTSATYQVIAEALGLAELSVRQRWEALHPPAEVARQLHMTETTPAFRSTSLFSDGFGTPLEVRVGWYPGTRYEFTINRTIDLG